MQRQDLTAKSFIKQQNKVCADYILNIMIKKFTDLIMKCTYDPLRLIFQEN